MLVNAALLQLCGVGRSQSFLWCLPQVARLSLWLLGHRVGGMDVYWALPCLAAWGMGLCSLIGEGYTVLSGWKSRPVTGFDRLFNSMIQVVH